MSNTALATRKYFDSFAQNVEFRAASNAVIILPLRKQRPGLLHARHYVTVHLPSRVCLCHLRIYLYFSAPLPVLGGGETALPLRDTSLPSAASRSRKSCQSSANDSLLLELLAINIGSDMEFREGVLGVRRKGDIGTRKEEPEDVPGRARPACSRCSDYSQPGPPFQDVVVSRV
jgi:hypothetical protein